MTPTTITNLIFTTFSKPHSVKALAGPKINNRTSHSATLSRSTSQGHIGLGLRCVILLLAVAVVVPLQAGTILLDFERLADGAIVTTQYTGLTFSNTIILTAGISLDELEFPPSSGVNVASDNGGPITIQFSSPITAFRAFFTYTQPVALAAFDDTGNQVATVTSAFATNLALSGGVGSSPNELLQLVFSSGIASVTITGNSNGGSFTMDDVAYTTISSNAPEPRTAFLIAAALVILSRLRIHKHHKSPPCHESLDIGNRPWSRHNRLGVVCVSAAYDVSDRRTSDSSPRQSTTFTGASNPESANISGSVISLTVLRRWRRSHHVVPLVVGLVASARPCLSQTAVMPPSVNPAAITIGVSTLVIVSARIASTGPQVLPAVNLLQVDQNGNNARIIGTLNDAGVDGDSIAGDGLFAGTATLNQSTTGQLFLEVSAAFRGVLRRTLSPIVSVSVVPLGMPISPRAANLARTTTDLQSALILCDELVVTMQSNAPLAAISTIINPIGGSLVGTLPALGLYQVALPTCDASSLANARTILLSNPSVSAADFNHVLDLTAPVSANPNDPYLVSGNQWALGKVAATGAWSIAQTLGVMRGATIGVLDSGVDSEHEDLRGEVMLGFSTATDTSDDQGHGTAVAGIAAAITNNGVGVASPAFTANVIAERVTMPGTRQATGISTALGIYDAVFHGARVINLSLGSPALDLAVLEAIQYAFKRNVVIVAAGGNNNTSAPIYPAGSSGIQNVIAVAATDEKDARAIWSTDLGGPCVGISGGQASNFGPWVTLYAPGSNIEVLEDNQTSGAGAYANICAGGTSYAAPLVSGTVSLLLGINPNLTSANVKSILSCSADVIGIDETHTIMRRLNMSKAAQMAASGQTSCQLSTTLTLIDTTSYGSSVSVTSAGNFYVLTALWVSPHQTTAYSIPRGTTVSYTVPGVILSGCPSVGGILFSASPDPTVGTFGGYTLSSSSGAFTATTDIPVGSYMYGVAGACDSSRPVGFLGSGDLSSSVNFGGTWPNGLPINVYVPSFNWSIRMTVGQ
jgi:subtilisin family serine protease